MTPLYVVILNRTNLESGIAYILKKSIYNINTSVLCNTVFLGYYEWLDHYLLCLLSLISIFGFLTVLKYYVLLGELTKLSA